MKRRLPNLEIGSILQLEPENSDSENGIQVSLIGYSPNQSLIVAPLSDQNSNIKEGMCYTAHSADGGASNGFLTKILSISTKPYLHFHLQYPESMKGGLLRRTQRLDTDTPAVVLSIHDGSHLLSVQMVDISMLGACLVATESLGRVGDRFSIDLQVSECHGEITFPFVIRYISQSANENGELIYQHGVEFSELDEHTISFISRFIHDSVTAQRRTRPALSIVK